MPCVNAGGGWKYGLYDGVFHTDDQSGAESLSTGCSELIIDLADELRIKIYNLCE